jgi:hypothetical protein
MIDGEGLVIGDAHPVFSPDGRWLVTTTGRLTSPEGECCMWRTDAWEMVRRQPLHRSSSSPAAVVVLDRVTTERTTLG